MDDTSSKGSAQGKESVADEQGAQVHLSRAKETAGSRLSQRKSIVRSFAKAWYHPSTA
jgi:hypothetical protein